MQRMMTAMAVAILALLAGTGLASAQDYTPATVSLSDATVVVGQEITISGTGFPANSTVTIEINPTLTTTSDAAGAFSVGFTIPEGMALGTHTVTVTSGAVTATSSFTIVAAGAGGLASTGSNDTLPLTRIALGLIGAGGVALAVGRRRVARRSRATESVPA